MANTAIAASGVPRTAPSSPVARTVVGAMQAHAPWPRGTVASSGLVDFLAGKRRRETLGCDGHGRDRNAHDLGAIDHADRVGTHDGDAADNTVIDAACEIGLERLEMAALADHLNTGVATLYGYVTNREHLMQMVAQRMAMDALRTIGWSTSQEVLRNHAEFCYSNFRSEPELAVSQIEGENGDEEVSYTRRLVDMLTGGELERPTRSKPISPPRRSVIGVVVMRLRRHTLEQRPVSDSCSTPLTRSATAARRWIATSGIGRASWHQVP